MSLLTKNEQLFQRWLKLFDANFLMIIIGVLTGLAINTLTGFGYQLLSVIAFLLFLTAIASIICMLQIQKHVSEDEAGFLELSAMTGKNTPENLAGSNQPFQNQNNAAIEQAVATDSKRRRWFFACSGLTVLCFIGGMIILYLTSSASQNSGNSSSNKLTEADSLIKVQGLELKNIEKQLAKEDSLLKILKNVQPVTVINKDKIKGKALKKSAEPR